MHSYRNVFKIHIQQGFISLCLCAYLCMCAWRCMPENNLRGHSSMLANNLFIYFDTGSLTVLSSLVGQVGWSVSRPSLLPQGWDYSRVHTHIFFCYQCLFWEWNPGPYVEKKTLYISFQTPSTIILCDYVVHLLNSEWRRLESQGAGCSLA